MYCTVLYCTVLYCTVLYCTVLLPVGVSSTAINRYIDIDTKNFKLKCENPSAIYRRHSWVALLISGPSINTRYFNC